MLQTLCTLHLNIKFYFAMYDTLNQKYPFLTSMMLCVRLNGLVKTVWQLRPIQWWSHSAGDQKVTIRRLSSHLRGYYECRDVNITVRALLVYLAMKWGPANMDSDGHGNVNGDVSPGSEKSVWWTIYSQSGVEKAYWYVCPAGGKLYSREKLNVIQDYKPYLYLYIDDIYWIICSLLWCSCRYIYLILIFENQYICAHSIFKTSVA